MRKFLVTALYDREKHMMIDSIRAKNDCDIHAITLCEMFELLDYIFTRVITITQLRMLFATKLISMQEQQLNNNIEWLAFYL